ncbi:MAG: HAD family hydrolase, partial [Candidatus Thorarchaeota archaeon]
IERAWKKEITEGDYETFTDDAITVLKELHARGYILGLVTRRHVSPVAFLKKAGLYDLFSTVRWTGVRGYAKPNPYSLIMAADDIGVNPRLCAYVGNWVDADVGAATRADMVPVLVTWADPKEAEKAPKGTIVIESLLELLHMFKGSQVSS